MNRVAIFVDAGYFFAQGSKALTDNPRPVPRHQLILNASKAVEALKHVADDRAPHCDLLRIYWYDGVPVGSGLTTDQSNLAEMDNVKLRLGIVNYNNQQKGVDSLIVTDLIELARLKSITDAVLLSPDEDVRVGVQIAQNYGVRVHLLGISYNYSYGDAQSRRTDQSPRLRQEVDTKKEWNRQDIKLCLSLRSPFLSTPQESVETQLDKENNPLDFEKGETLSIESLVDGFVDKISDQEINEIKNYWNSGRREIPSNFDRRMLGECRAKLGNLGDDQRKKMRARFHQAVENRAPSPPPN